MGTSKTIRPTEGVNRRMVVDDEDVEGHGFDIGQPGADEVNRRMDPESINKRMEPAPSKRDGNDLSINGRVRSSSTSAI
jgi:hypothetical protein